MTSAVLSPPGRRVSDASSQGGAVGPVDMSEVDMSEGWARYPWTEENSQDPTIPQHLPESVFAIPQRSAPVAWPVKLQQAVDQPKRVEPIKRSCDRESGWDVFS